jgi:hypothetical protein
VFITECEFDNTDMEGTASIKLQHISDFLTYLSVKWRLNPLNHQFRICGSHKSVGVPNIVYNCTSLIRYRNIFMVHKTYKRNHKQLLFFKTQCWCQNYIIRICCNSVFKFNLLLAVKLQLLCYNEMYYKPVIKTLFCAKTCLKVYKLCDTN